jgi:hypothetical protein
LKYVLDDEKLNGTEPTRITFRPARYAEPVRIGDVAHFREVVEYRCQVWGGANVPVIPTAADGQIDPSYARILPGSAIDGVSGLDRYGLFHLAETKVTFPKDREGHRNQLAVALLKYRRQKKYSPLAIPELQAEDPWRDVYAATLGLLPPEPDEKILRHGNLVPELRFEDFLRVERPNVRGSLEDLLGRLDQRANLTPRMASLIHLAVGGGWNNGIRSQNEPIPRPNLIRLDAGPNVVVVCSPGSVEDLALLWNLRAAAGEQFVLPIGVPLGEVGTAELQRLATHDNISRHGFATNSTYVTSASLTVQDLTALFGEATSGPFGYASQRDLLDFGFPAGWVRDEVLVWNDGETSLVPLAPDAHPDVMRSNALGRLVGFEVDVHVLSDPFPRGNDVRADAFGRQFYAGSLSRGVSSDKSAAVDVQWPSRMLMARTVAGCRGVELRESEPGRAGRVAVTSLLHLWELDYLAHAPLLDFLEEMAAHTGISFYKRRQQQQGQTVEPSEVVARTIDDLPEKSMHDFKRVLGNNQDAAKSWLLWAEQRGLIVKGFQLQCEKCGSKQWIPVAAFAPPIICRGCAAAMETPFGDRPTADFKYRLSERMRRVYEHDAMGHLMTMRFFHWIFGGSFGSELIGLHPGIEVRLKETPDPVGEADVLMLLAGGDLIPMEVKHSFTGMTDEDITKLDRLAELLRSPWSALIVSKYGKDATADFVAREHRTVDSDPFRLILSYDLLLSKHPFWSMGGDPFEWAPLTQKDIETREHEFVKDLATNAPGQGGNWMELDLLRTPERP